MSAAFSSSERAARRRARDDFKQTRVVLRLVVEDVEAQIVGLTRQRYVLTFTPEGVKTGDGWHSLQVR
jgi:hypothetical protein